MSSVASSSLNANRHPFVPRDLVESAQPFAGDVAELLVGWPNSRYPSFDYENKLVACVAHLANEGLLGLGARAAVLATHTSIIAAGTMATLFNPVTFLVNPVAAGGQLLNARAWWHTAAKTEAVLATPAANALAHVLGAAVGLARSALQPGADVPGVRGGVHDRPRYARAAGKCVSSSPDDCEEAGGWTRQAPAGYASSSDEEPLQAIAQAQCSYVVAEAKEVDVAHVQPTARRQPSSTQEKDFGMDSVIDGPVSVDVPKW